MTSPDAITRQRTSWHEDVSRRGRDGSSQPGRCERRAYVRLFAVVICIVTCPEGIATVEAEHPDVKIFAAAIDDCLNDKKYIVPGLGDAGDRLFGTSQH